MQALPFVVISEMSIIGIVAVARNGAIGKGGTLPWHYSADMKHFKQTTIGNACVMGYRTWLTLKRPLKDRLNIVLSRQSEIVGQDSVTAGHDSLVAGQDSVITLREVTSVVSLSRYLNCDLFVIGGAKVYQSFLPCIERWIVTEVPLVVEDADAFVPKGYLENFQKIDSKKLEEGLTVSFYQRH